MRLVGQEEKERRSDPAPARRTPPTPTGPGAEKATWLPKMPPRPDLALVRARAGS